VKSIVKYHSNWTVKRMMLRNHPLAARVLVADLAASPTQNRYLYLNTPGTSAAVYCLPVQQANAVGLGVAG